MDDRLQLWEILKAVTEGAYVCGDTFTNQVGDIIYVDIRHNLIMSDNELDTSYTWEYVEDGDYEE